MVPISILYCCCNLPSCGADLSWTSIGPGGGGWIQAIACDPRDPQTIYLGCDVGGFYISRDGGRPGRIQNEGLNNYFVECIAVHPTDSTIRALWAWKGASSSRPTGEDLGMEAPGVSAARALRLLRPHRRPVLRPEAGPMCSTRASAGRGGGRMGRGQIYKSEDCGETWRLVTREGVLDARAVVGDLEVAPEWGVRPRGHRPRTLPQRRRRRDVVRQQPRDSGIPTSRNWPSHPPIHASSTAPCVPRRAMRRPGTAASGGRTTAARRGLGEAKGWRGSSASKISPRR